MPVTTPAHRIDFPPYRLDLRAGQLYRVGTPVRLRPKTFAVLQHLAERPGELLTKQALLDAVWGDVAVSEDVVRLSVGELRAVLGDARATPRFIETVPRRGYRFIATMGAAATGTALPALEETSHDSSAPDGVVVGRARERGEIAEWLRAATRGRRQIGFVTGEAGIGKTTLVDTALRELAHVSGARLAVARGQCIEQYGGGEPYLPVLAALATLCRGSDGPRAGATLRDHAPGWLLGAMGVLAPGEVDGAATAANSHEHTLQRLAASLDALATDTPLVLVLEDLQWSDYSTVDLLSVVAQRREPARLLVLCTLRPAEAIVRAHPITTVKRELLRKGLGREILLGGLSAAEVGSYLAARFPAAHLPDDLLPLLVDRSEGCPFFLVTIVDHLIDRHVLVDGESGWELRGGGAALRTAIPDGLRAVIEPRLERLTADELRVLEAASVAGPEFAADVVAGAAPHGSELGDVEVVEQLCDRLARRQEILRIAGDSAWPNDTTTARYAFRHVFYQQVIYQRLAFSTRRRLHQAIGERMEAAHDGRTADIASELAAHFERSGDIDRAVRFHAEAAARARARFSYGETRLHLETALALMRGQPETPNRMQQQMPLLDHLGWTSFALRGWGDEGGARAFAQMREIAERLDGALARFQAMEGQLIGHVMRAEYAAARAGGEEMLVLAEQLGNRSAAGNALPVLGATLMHLGELRGAHDLAERGRSLCDPQEPTLQGISCCNLLAATYAHLGLVAQARATNRECVALAAKLDLPYARAHAANFAASVYLLMRDVRETRALAEDALRVAIECGFSVLRITATLFRGWCDVEEGRLAEGLTAMRDAFAEYVTTGQRISTTAYGLPIAQAHLASGDLAGANHVLDASLAFMAETGERLYEHELYRLKGECRLASAATHREKCDAIEYFERAIAIAAEQQALLFELRAATSLCRVQPKSARERLARLVDRFPAEDVCADLRAARALLAARDS